MGTTAPFLRGAVPRKTYQGPNGRKLAAFAIFCLEKTEPSGLRAFADDETYAA